MNTEDAFTPEQMTAVVGALHNASMEKWIGAGLICIIGAVVIVAVFREVALDLKAGGKAGLVAQSLDLGVLESCRGSKC